MRKLCFMHFQWNGIFLAKLYCIIYVFAGIERQNRVTVTFNSSQIYSPRRSLVCSIQFSFLFLHECCIIIIIIIKYS